MKVLMIGGGGREHALAWKLSTSKRVGKVYCAPGNPGMENFATLVPIKADDVTALVSFAKDERIDLTVVGPEAPLAAGIVDAFKREGRRIFGPTKEAAALESSKAFAKEFCKKYGIPAASSKTFSDAAAAKEYAKSHEYPLVVKADGLAAGKGVCICKDHGEAARAIDEMMTARCFGDAGRLVVIEEFLRGEEASFIAICDGNHVMPLAGSQDHKAAFDGDTGPNTGGMGAVSPTPVITPSVQEKVMEKIMLPASRAMVTEGIPFVGVLYAGLMVKDGEPKVLEFNVRMGDPETEALIVRLKTDLYEIFDAAISGTLDKISPVWDKRASACVVMASGGYPGSYEKGKEIRGLDEALSLPDVFVFQAGTKRVDGRTVTDGGRVLGVTALGDGMEDAVARAYEAVSKISFEGAHYRKDIGKKAIQGGGQ